MIRRIWLGVGLSGLAVMSWAAVTLFATDPITVKANRATQIILTDTVAEKYRAVLNGEFAVEVANQVGTLELKFLYDTQANFATNNALRLTTGNITRAKNSIDTKVSYTILDLSCGSSYWVQLVARDITDSANIKEYVSAQTGLYTPPCQTFAITTEAANNVVFHDPGLDLHSASLNGRISPTTADHSYLINYTFVYGIKGNTSSFKETGVSYGFSLNNVTARVVPQTAIDLRCATTYQFHIVATNKLKYGVPEESYDEVRAGKDLEFVTPACQIATLTDERTDDIKDDQATISVIAHPFGRAATAKVQWGEPNQAGGFVTGTEGILDNIAIPAGNKVYPFSAKAANLKCNKVYLAQATLTQLDSTTIFKTPGFRFTTSPCVPPPSVVFTDKGIQRVTSTSAVFSATTILNVASGSARFEYGDGKGGWTALPTQFLPAGNATEPRKVIGHVSSLLCDKTYSVRFFASSGKNTTESATLSFTTEACGGKDLLKRATAVGKLSAGGAHTLLIRSDSTVSAWGDNSSGQLGVDAKTWWIQEIVDEKNQLLADVTSVSAGGASSAAVARGLGYFWGANAKGQLGRGNVSTGSAPVQAVLYDASDNTLACQQGQLCDVIRAVAGEMHGMAISAQKNQTVFSWGNNGNGQLGDGTLDAHYYARTVLGPRGKLGVDGEVADIAVGAKFSLALRKDSRVMAWGANDQGQLGDLQMETFRSNADEVGGLKGVIAIAAGRAHALALVQAEVDKGTVVAWGANDAGQLGVDKVLYPEEFQSSIVAVTDPQGLQLKSIVAIAAGADHSLALQENGIVLAWGGNAQGQLGDGTQEAKNQPVTVMVDSANELTSVVAIAAGENFSLALLNDGTVYGWGDNRRAQLGGLVAEFSVYATPVVSPLGMMNYLTDPKLLVNAHAFTLGAGKNSAKLNISLPAPPAERVVVDILLDGELKLFTPKTLAFDSGNWSAEQTVEFSLSKTDGGSGIAFVKLAADGYEPLAIPVVIEATPPVAAKPSSKRGATGWELGILAIMLYGVLWTRRRIR